MGSSGVGVTLQSCSKLREAVPLAKVFLKKGLTCELSQANVAAGARNTSAMKRQCGWCTSALAIVMYFLPSKTGEAVALETVNDTQTSLTYTAQGVSQEEVWYSVSFG